VLYSRHY